MLDYKAWNNIIPHFYMWYYKKYEPEEFENLD